VAASVSSTSEAAFAALKARAEADPGVLGLWLGGSRGKGRATDASDHDCGLVVADDAVAAWRAWCAARAPDGIDAAVFTQRQFAAYAAWDGPQAWDRYSFVDVRALIDRTGDIQALIDDKARIPPAAIEAFAAAALDRFVNQAYRAMKCARDGDALASRLEAAQAPEAALDFLFAIDGGRLRPYPKYLGWELQRRPLEGVPWTGAALLALVDQALGAAPAPALQALLDALTPLARSRGHGATLDAWGAALPWMLAWSPDNLPRGHR